MIDSLIIILKTIVVLLVIFAVIPIYFYLMARWISAAITRSYFEIKKEYDTNPLDFMKPKFKK